MGYSFQLARVLLYALSHRQDNTYHGYCYTSCGTLAGTKKNSMGQLWRIDLMTHRTMSRSYLSGALPCLVPHNHKENVLSESLNKTFLSLPFLYAEDSKMYLRGKSIRSLSDGSSVRSFMGWTHWAISRSSQCSTTGVTKAVVCVILSVGWCI